MQSREVLLAETSTWRIGGFSRVTEPANTREIARTVGQLEAAGTPWVAIGESTNLLFDSRGFSGVLIRVSSNMSKVRIQGDRVIAEGGAAVPVLVRYLASAGLAGMEHAAGIPGTIGGLVVMNGGTARRGVGEVVARAVVVGADGSTRTLSAPQLGFGYRQSSFQNGREILAEVELSLAAGSPRDLVAKVANSEQSRARKFPLDVPNCGSTFLSDPKMYELVGPPGKIIEDAGLKGLRRGGAEVSAVHANFVVNVGGATDDDVLWLIATVRREVFERTGYLMECEVRHVDLEGRVRPAHHVSAERWPSIDPGGKQ